MTDKGSSVLPSSQKLKELTIRRSSIKGQITKFKNYLSPLKRQEYLSNIELAELNLKITKFEALSVKFDDLQSEIEVLNSEDIDSEIDERELIEHDIIINIATAKSLVETHTDNVKDQSQCFHDHKDFGFKLPQLQISKFNGAHFHWLEFRDTFESLIHNNNRISPIHKFHYLNSYLEGDASRLIANLEVSSANYPEAWKIISERYNNKRSLINHHLQSLFNIQPIARESDRSLRYLVDHVTKNLRALASLDQPTDKWDILLIFMLTAKLDNQTLVKWEEYRNTLDDVPSLNQFHTFLNDRADVLESLNRHKGDNTSSKSASSSRNFVSNNSNKGHSQRFNHNRVAQTKSLAVINQRNTKYTCIICDDSHRIYDCPVFKSKSLQDRLADVSKYKLCSNCLRQGHLLADCRMGPCRECKQRHNSLLHDKKQESNSNTVVNASEFALNISNQTQNQVLLSTALIDVCNPITKQVERVRALLDCGSQSTFISKHLKQILSLNSKVIDPIRVIGIGNTCANQVIETCTAQLNSINNSYNLTASCYVLENLTSEIPKAPLDLRNIQIPKNLLLADPMFHQPARIDVLIGADIFWEILGNETKPTGIGGPKLRSSKFGWLISGPMPLYSKDKGMINCNHSALNSLQNNIENIITKFWEIEELPKRPILSNTERLCENHFIQNTTRLDNGRFCVRLPLLDTPDCLGDSYNLAKKRFLNLEKRFRRNPSLKLHYTKFIDEYAELGHLSESNVTKRHNSYFLCHHAVFKENSESTQLRVVFDGSACSSSGFALNDILMVGPNMQDSLFAILIRSRQYKFILCGDISKFYRQVQVHDKDRDLQLILWRRDESEPIKPLRLNTLTYGTASASYLSTRCLWQVGEEQEDKLIKTIIQNDFYIDDLITGCNDEHQLIYIKNSITNALNEGCFNLRKFKSNSSTVLEQDKLNSQDHLTISQSSSTLGLGWDPSSDCLNFPLKDFDQQDKVTKRSILSNSSKIFDPLGLLSPCIIQPKIIMQRLWKEKLDWDQPVPKNIKEDWLKIYRNFSYLNDFHVPRLVLCNNPKEIELHTFSDASQSAYGACVYMRSIDSNNQVSVHLLCSKSKVSPVKPMTMPRLELCAALLAARLCETVLESLRYTPTRIFHWCDSSIVIAWINSEVSKLKTFVANRIMEIHEKTQPSSWLYVPTATNPADLISRGVDASKLVLLKLWWSGPDFLYENITKWPKLNKNDIKSSKILPEIKSNPTVISEIIIKFERFSKFNRLVRSMAYVNRFIHNLKNPKYKILGDISLKELEESFNSLCIIAQRQSFSVEYDILHKNKQLSSKSKLLSLSPFMDRNKLIRVGGRLDNSGYPYEKKHPILLHSSHHLTKLYFEKEHLQNMHAGPQLLLATIRETVWPVNGRLLARKTVSRCVVCKRLSGNTLRPKMGELPSQRVTPGFPFLSVGLDFAGPFYILNRKGRGSKLIKCYLCLFVCLRYKCIHLEAVSDLSKDAFLMTLRRFIARRGKPAEIFCDNGRNFVAAAKELSDFLKCNKDPLSQFATQEKVQFKFSPPYGSHFGGIFEAGVKSAKFHLKRVIGNSHLTFEEILTLFAQIEAILNSRPLYPLSSSPDDFLCLTPGHFITGRPLTALPSPDFRECRETNLRRYQRIEKLRQHFWNRWQKEYIAELQQRSKWKISQAKLNVGDLVLLQEDNVPPLNWRLGRVVRLFPGPDGISRVADVNTIRGCVRRPLVRLCPLPAEEDSRVESLHLSTRPEDVAARLFIKRA